MKRKSIATALALLLLTATFLTWLPPARTIQANTPLAPNITRTIGQFLTPFTPLFTGVAYTWDDSEFHFYPPGDTTWEDMATFNSMADIPYIFWRSDWDNFDNSGFFDRYGNRIYDAVYINDIWINDNFYLYDIEDNGIPIIIMSATQFVANGITPFSFFRYVNGQYQYVDTIWSAFWGQSWHLPYWGLQRDSQGRNLIISNFESSTSAEVSAYYISFSGTNIIKDYIGTWGYVWDGTQEIEIPPPIDLSALTPIPRLTSLADSIRASVLAGEFEPNGTQPPATPSAASYFNGNYYKIFEEWLTWYEANIFAQQLGGHLASITSHYEQEFIESLMRHDNANRRVYWVGGTNDGNEGEWRWVNGDPFMFTNWAPGEPNNHGGIEHYIVLFTEDAGSGLLGQWNDSTYRNTDIWSTGLIVQWSADAISAAPEHPVVYVHAPPPPHHIFTPAPLTDIHNQASAEAEITRILAGLTPEQRQSGEALNIATLNIETAASMGTTQYAPQDGNINAAMLQSGAGIAGQIHQNTQGTLASEGVTLLRDLRTNINFASDEAEEMQITFPEDVSHIPFDNVTIESSFATVALNRAHIPQGGEINIRPVAIDESNSSPINGEPNGQANENTPAGEASDPTGAQSQAERLRERLTDFSSPQTILANYWSVLVIIVLLIIWLTIAGLGEKLRRWVVPTIALIAIAANLGLVIIRINNEPPAHTPGAYAAQPEPATHPTYVDTVEITMTEGMRATISLPTNGQNPEFLVIVNETGQIQHSRYNPVTGNIDARIRTSGTYTLYQNQVSFTDIQDQSQLMQHAITQLAARGIMQGATEGYFHPHDPISRTDMVTTIISAFDMLDTAAQAPFTDINPQAWYYLAIATAHQAGLLSGFEDNTFRGNLDMPKDQLVVVAANNLIGQMGYHIPADIEYFLSRFLDREQLASWSEDGIALSTASNVLIHRADGLFAPRSIMTRGDAAIVLYRVFSRVW